MGCIETPYDGVDCYATTKYIGSMHYLIKTYRRGGAKLLIYENEGFVLAAENNRFPIMKWLYSHGNIRVESILEASLAASENGNTEIVRWVYRLDAIDLNDHIKRKIFTICNTRWSAKDYHVRRWLINDIKDLTKACYYRIIEVGFPDGEPLDHDPLYSWLVEVSGFP